MSRVRRGSTVRVRQRACNFRLLSRCSRCLGWRRPRALASTQRPPVSTVAVVRHSAGREGGLRARVRRVRGGRNAGRSWSGWRPCSGRGRRSRCRYGVRRWRRCVGDRRSCAEARSRLRVVPAFSGGRGSCGGRGSRPPRRETAAGCSDWAAGVRSHSSAIACSGTARRLASVLVHFSRPFVNEWRT